MKLTIDLTGLDGEELAKAKVRAEKVLAQFFYSPDELYSILTGNVVLPNVVGMAINTEPKEVVFKDSVKDIAYLPLSALRFEIKRLPGEESLYIVKEVIE